MYQIRILDYMDCVELNDVDETEDKVTSSDEFVPQLK